MRLLRNPFMLLAVGLITSACTKDITSKAVPTPTPTATPQVSRAVGPTGGSLVTNDHAASVIIPEGALSTNVTLSVEKVAKGSLTVQTFALTSEGYDFGPSGTQFSVPVTLSLASDAAPAAGQRLVLAYLQSGGVWNVLTNSTYDASQNTVSAPVSHFTVFAVVSIATDGTGCTTLGNPDAFCAPNVCSHNDNKCVPRPADVTTYAVGGSVHGLDGNLTLGVTGDLTTNLSADGNFAFADAVVAGQAFEVTVVHAPDQQLCVVANGVSQGAQANTTNVTITCTVRTYSIGGYVSGLPNGASVGLSNGTDALTVSANGNFVFAAPVNYGQGYTVTVNEPPNHYDCVVARGTGLDVHAAVTNIAVTCSIRTFAVGGSVSGLGSGHTVDVTNGNAVLTLSQNGAFALAAPLAYGQPYSITIAAQPTAQWCSVTGGAGTLNNANVTNVAVACVDLHAVVGTITGLDEGTLTVANGNDAVQVTYPTTSFGLPTLVDPGSQYSVAVAAQPLGLLCAPQSGEGQVGNSNVSVTIACRPYLHFDGDQSAAFAIGQNDLVSGAVSVDAVHIQNPQGTVFASRSGKLFVPDYDHWRVLGFNALPTQNAAQADVVLGQADLQSQTSWSASSPSAFNTYPASIAGDDNHLVVTDSYTNRVLIFAPLPNTNKPDAITALGAPNLTTEGTAACDANSFDEPWGAAVGGGKILISDRRNHRVLIWNTIPTQSGTTPHVVLGQTDFDHCNANAGGAVSASTLDFPQGLWTDGTRVIVADSNNHRILWWNAFPTVNGQAADGVLGQPNLTSNTTSSDPAVSVVYPTSVTADGNSIMVAEPAANRVSIWANSPNATLTAVLGQADAASVACNRGDNTTPAAANTLCAPHAVAMVKSKLYISDTDNNRVVVYQSR